MVYFLKDTRVHIFLIIWASLCITLTKANVTNTNPLAKFVRSLVEPFVQSLITRTESNTSETTIKTIQQNQNATLQTQNHIRANSVAKVKKKKEKEEAAKEALTKMQLHSVPSKPESGEVPMLRFIQNKVDSLKPFLEDDDVPEHDGLRLEGDEETTIIEFVPNIVSKDSTDKRSKGDKNKKVEDYEKVLKFQSKIYKYKKMRNKIRKALKTENITENTKEMVTKTIDKMIAHMNAHKCKWADDTDTAKGQIRRSSNRKSPPEKLIEKWNVLWDALKRNITEDCLKITGSIQTNEQQKFLMKFQKLVSLMTNELNHLVSKYKIVCSDTHDKGNSKKPDIEMDDNNAVYPILKSIKHYNDDQVCSHFKVCSQELTDFIYKFYNGLNSSAISVVENYAAMFLRDVSDDGYHEKERIVSIIRKTSKIIETKLDILFRKETLKLELDYKRNQYFNMRTLHKFLRKTIASSKKQVLKEIQSALVTVRYKVMDTIKQDVEVNLNSEMALLEKYYNERVCPTFAICNGRIYKTRKAMPYVGHSNNVFVQVKHETDEIQESSTKTNYKTMKKGRVIQTKPPKIHITRTAPRIAQLESKVDPATAKVKEDSPNRDQAKTDKDDIDHSLFDKSKQICSYKGKSLSKPEIHQYDCIYNDYARKIQKEIEANLISAESHEIKLLNPSNETPTAKELSTKTKQTFKPESHKEVTEITKTRKEHLSENMTHRRMKINRNQWDKLLKRMKGTREKMAVRSDKTNTEQRNIAIYR